MRHGVAAAVLAFTVLVWTTGAGSLTGHESLTRPEAAPHLEIASAYPNQVIGHGFFPMALNGSTAAPEQRSSCVRALGEGHHELGNPLTSRVITPQDASVGYGAVFHPRYEDPPTLPTRSVNHLATSPGGELWLATSSGMFRMRPDSVESPAWAHYSMVDGLPDIRVDAVAVTSDGTVWAATVRGLARLEMGAERFALVGVTAGESVHAVAADGSGGVWIRTPGELWHVDTDGAWRAFPTGADNPEDDRSRYSLAAGPDRAAWFATAGFIHRVAIDGEARTWSWPEGSNVRFGSVGSSGIAVDTDGAAWIAVNWSVGFGAIRITPDGVIEPLDHLELEFVDGATTTPDGAVWFTSDSGLVVRLQEGEVEQVVAGGEPVGSAVAAIASGPDGSVWIVGQDAVLSLHSDTAPAEYAVGEPENAQLGGFVLPHDGGMWVGADWIAPNGAVELSRGAAPRTLGRGMYVSDTAVWYAGAGVTRLGLDDGRFDYFGSEAGLPSLRVLDIEGDDAGRVWVGTDAGLWIYDPDAQTQVDPPALPHPTVLDAESDGHGGMWLLTVSDFSDPDWVATLVRVDPYGSATVELETQPGDPEPVLLARDEHADASEPGGGVWVIGQKYEGDLTQVYVRRASGDGAPEFVEAPGVGPLAGHAAGDGRVLVLRDDDVYAYDGARWTSMILPYDNYGGLAVHPRTGSVFTFGSGSVVSVAKDGTVTPTRIDRTGLSRSFSLPSQVAFDAQGDLWIRQPDGVAERRPDEGWDWYGLAGQPLERPGRGSVDADGTAWFAMPYGLARFDAGWTNHASGHGVPWGVADVDATKPGELWVAYEFGEAVGLRRNDGSWSHFTPAGAERFNVIRADRAVPGYAWAGSNDGLFLLDASGPSVEVVHGITVGHVGDIVLHRDGTVWFAGAQGIGCVEASGRGAWFQETWGSTRYGAVTVDLQGGVWFARDAGSDAAAILYLTPEGTWLTFAPDHGVTSREVVDLATDARGRVWVATSNGGTLLLDVERLEAGDGS